MSHAKEHFLSILGLENDGYNLSLLLTHDLMLQRKDESEPFGELITKGNKVILRIGAVLEDGITVFL